MSDNAKLRELRRYVADHEAYFQAKRLSANYGDGHANASWAAHRIVRERIDEMLAEPPPHRVEDVLAGFKAIEDGRYTDVGEWVSKLEDECRRVTLAEEVARLFGYVGPDGKGRP